MENNHTKQYSSWKIQDDLYLLKNYKPGENESEIGAFLKRTNWAVKGRWYRLSKSSSRVKEVARSFPEANITNPFTENSENIKETNNQHSNLSHQPSIMKRYTIEDELYIANNLDKKDNVLALKLNRGSGAISVKKSEVKRKLRDSSSKLYRAWKKQNKMTDLGNVLLKDTSSVKAPKVAIQQSSINGNTVTVPFKDIQIDWSTKSLIFTIN